MARIAVITAPNPGYDNPGMLTVDLAFDAFVRRFDPALDVSWFTLVPPGAAPLRRYVDPAALPFRFRPLAESLDEVYAHDAVVYWGDFLHARSWLEKDAARHVRRHGLAPDEAAGRRLLHQCYLMADASDEVLAKTVLFGGTILPDPEPDDSDYGRALRRLVGGARAVLMREPVSAERVTRIRGGSCLGLDAAFLLPPDAAGARDTIGVFAGVRTPIPPGFVRFCRALARRLDARVEWLPWLRFRRFKPRRWRRHVARLALGGTGKRVPFADMVAGLAGHRAVVTDTYHLCVNAWRQGTPALCLGRDEGGAGGALGDRKKRVLYSMFGAGGFHLGASLPPVEHAAALVESNAVAGVAGRVRRAVERAESALRGALYPSTK